MGSGSGAEFEEGSNRQQIIEGVSKWVVHPSLPTRPARGPATHLLQALLRTLLCRMQMDALFFCHLPPGVALTDHLAPLAVGQLNLQGSQGG